MPDFTPAHQLDLLTGISGGIGGLALGLPIMLGSLINPVVGSVCASLLMLSPLGELLMSPKYGLVQMDVHKTRLLAY